MEAKRLFQVFDEMNVADGENNTRNLAVCSNFIRSNQVKAGTEITMGVPNEAHMKLIDGSAMAILLIVDKADYNNRK